MSFVFTKSTAFATPCYVVHSGGMEVAKVYWSPYNTWELWTSAVKPSWNAKELSIIAEMIKGLDAPGKGEIDEV